MDFIDVAGVSADYRLRTWPEGDGHVRMAGNYVVARARQGALEILTIGVTDDLSGLRSKVAALPAGDRLFTRLTVARAARETVHADLVARHPTARVEVNGG
jgi:hypothetical protein